MFPCCFAGRPQFLCLPGAFTRVSSSTIKGDSRGFVPYSLLFRAVQAVEVGSRKCWFHEKGNEGRWDSCEGVKGYSCASLTVK